MKALKKGGIFSTFFLGEKEFALNVTSVREVVNPPAIYTAVPLSSKHLLGMFNLRGTIIPVLDLHNILGHSSELKTEKLEAKIAIVEYEQFYVGLLFDGTSEVIKVGEDKICELSFKSGNGVGKSEFLRLDDGKKVIQILDVKRIVENESLIEIRKNQIAENKLSNLKKNRGPRKQCITFMTEGAHCAFSIEAIQEIIKIDKIEESALAHQDCIGMTHLRGKIVPIIDFSSYLEHKTAEHGAQEFEEEKKIIVMKCKDGLFGLLVESVESIVSHYADEIAPFTVHTRNKEGVIKGCLNIDEKSDTLMIDESFVFNDTFIINVAGGHKKIYENNVVDMNEKAKKSMRKTYLTFNLNKLYGFEIKTVKEIIDYNESLMRPSELDSIYKGVMNLRGDLILIIDTRAIYGIAEDKSISQGKVLIVERGNEKFGFLVDSVNEILNVNENHFVSELPEFFRNDPSSLILKDIKETIQIKDGQQSKTLMVLGVEEILSRVVVTQPKLAA